MTNIYIVYDTKGDPTTVLAANCKRDVEIALIKDKTCHEIEEIDLSKLPNKNGIAFLLTSIKANSRVDFDHRIGGVDFRIWQRV